MSKDRKEIPCFGFFNSDPVCDGCPASKRCRAILVSNGFDLVSSLIDELSSSLPGEARYNDTDRVTTLVDQLIKPPPVRPIAPEMKELLQMVGVPKGDPDLADLI